MKNLHRYFAMLIMFISVSITAQTTISGTVLDDQGETIIGATIVEKGSASNGTITDYDGNFTLIVNKDVIVVSYVGMKSQDVNVKGKKNVKVILSSLTQDLDEVVVVDRATIIGCRSYLSLFFRSG